MITQFVAGFAKLGDPQLMQTISDLEKRIKNSISAQAKALAKPVSAGNEQLLKQLAELGFTPSAAAAQQPQVTLAPTRRQQRNQLPVHGGTRSSPRRMSLRRCARCLSRRRIRS